MPRSMTKRKRTGKYNCKLFERARAAEARLKLITDAHDRCISEREWRIAQLDARLKGTCRLFAAAVVSAGGEIELNLIEVDKLNERNVSVRQTGDDTFAYKYIGADKSEQAKAVPDSGNNSGIDS